MTRLGGAIFEEAERLRDFLAERGFRPYRDFEIVTVTLSDGALEIDPFGQLERLRPTLEAFANARGFWLLPFDPYAGTLSLVREGAFPFAE